MKKLCTTDYNYCVQTANYIENLNMAEKATREFVTRQMKLQNKIANGFVNLEKRGKMTSGATQIQIKLIEEYWRNFQKEHENFLATGAVDADHEYFKKEFIDDVEQIYAEVLGDLKEHLNSLERSGQFASGGQVYGHLKEQDVENDDGDEIELKILNIPKFSGKIEDWFSFKYVFNSLIIEKNTKNDLVKLHYLQNNVTGEAFELIKDFELIPDNFRNAWIKLEGHYENKRRVVNMHLNSLFSLKRITTDTSAEIRRIINGTISPLNSLKDLQRPTDQWEDIVVFLTISKLSDKLKKCWEEKLDKSTEPPEFAELKSFLIAKERSYRSSESFNKTKFTRTLSNLKKRKTNKAAEPNSERIVNNKSLHKSQSQEDKNLNLNSNDSNKQSDCAMCGEPHYIFNCQQFISHSVEQRHAFIKKLNMCFNCLGDHPSVYCRSKYRCNVCNRKHHTMLHFIKKKSVSKPVLTC